MKNEMSPPNRRILVIDDNLSIHQDFRKILNPEPGNEAALAEHEAVLFGKTATGAATSAFQIDSALQGAEGLARVRQALQENQPFAMAFVDVRMPPGWDGIETAKRIWEVSPDMQIVICTAYADSSWSQMQEKLNPLDRLLILKKPFDSVEVLQLAHALTEKWRLTQDSRSKLADLERMVGERTIELEKAREAALNMMGDAVEARTRAEPANEDLKAQISVRKQAEQNLATQHAITQALAESTTLNTPVISASGTSNSAAALLSKIESIGKLMGDRVDPQLAVDSGGATSFFSRRNRLVALGASAGRPAALSSLLAGLPGNFPAAIVLIQHVDEQFVTGLAEWLGKHTALRVGLAREGEEPALGAVLIAGTSDHLVLTRSNRFAYTPEPRDYPYRPSVDVFFESVAKHWHGDVAAVLLTGMGRDGAKGLKTLRNRGHYTIAQDQATSAVYGMPKAAAALDAAVDILPLERIAPALTELFVATVDYSIQS